MFLSTVDASACCRRKGRGCATVPTVKSDDNGRVETYRYSSNKMVREQGPPKTSDRNVLYIVSSHVSPYILLYPLDKFPKSFLLYFAIRSWCCLLAGDRLKNTQFFIYVLIADSTSAANVTLQSCLFFHSSTINTSTHRTDH